MKKKQQKNLGSIEGRNLKQNNKITIHELTRELFSTLGSLHKWLIKKIDKLQTSKRKIMKNKQE